MKKIIVNTLDTPNGIMLDTIEYRDEENGYIDTDHICEMVPVYDDHERTHESFIDMVRQHVREYNNSMGNKIKRSETVAVDYGEHFSGAGYLYIPFSDFYKNEENDNA